jgi:hypothetical protein
MCLKASVNITESLNLSPFKILELTHKVGGLLSRWAPWAWSVRRASKVLESSLSGEIPHKFQARDGQPPSPILSSLTTFAASSSTPNSLTNVHNG